MYPQDHQAYFKPETDQTEQAIELYIRGRKVLNFCTANYLGLSHPKITQKTIKSRVQKLPSENHAKDNYNILEKKISDFLKMEDSLVCAGTYDANGGVLDSLFTQDDAIIFDELNYTSFGSVNLNRSNHYKYKNNLHDLEAQLKKASLKSYRFKVIVTDGVFPINGTIANLKEICTLAKKYSALVFVNDADATGFIGKTGRGTHEYNEVTEQVDIITSTFGEPFGWFISGKKKSIELLRNRPQPYLFSNSLAPETVDAVIQIIDMLSKDNSRAKKVMENADYFRNNIKKAGFDIVEGNSAIVPVMLYDTRLAQEFADKLLEEGIYVVGFFYPVVPKGKAGVRVQLSAAHTLEHLDKAINSFSKVGKELAII